MSANFNYNSLSPAMSSNLQEIARMAWGSGVFEGKSGGAGRMGVIRDSQGNPRIIKFNTKSIERSFGQSVASNKSMLDSADNLRMMLRDITNEAFKNGLPENTRNEIYAKLGLDQAGNLKERTGNETGKDLLSRKVVAQVVSKLGGDQIWQDAWAGHDRASYSTSGNRHTQFKDVWAGEVKDNATILNSTVRTMEKILGNDFAADILRELKSMRQFGADGAVREGARFLLKNQNVLEGMFGQGVFRGLSEKEFTKAVESWCRSDYEANKNMSADAIRSTFTASLQGVWSLKGISRFGVDEIQMQRLGLTFSDLESAINEMAGKYNLNPSQKLSVSKMTMAYLAAKLGNDESRTTPIDKQTLLKQIADGTFDGTFIGLVRSGFHKCPLPKGEKLSMYDTSFSRGATSSPSCSPGWRKRRRTR